MESSLRYSSRKAILITGVSSGIGAGMARMFLRNGFLVFGSVRSEDKAEKARIIFGDGFEPLVFDVCDEHQVELARGTFERKLNGLTLEAIINNAGMAEIGPLLHVSAESFRRQLDVLVVGQLTVIQHFHSFLGGQDNSAGTIYNISSVSGQGANPLFGCYAAGKHALEGLSKTLRSELRRYGTRVVVVAPANIATEIWPKQSAELIEPYKGTDYFDALEALTNKFSVEKPHDAMSIEEFSEAMYRIYCIQDPASRYTIYKGRWGPSPLNKFFRNRVRIMAR